MGKVPLAAIVFFISATCCYASIGYRYVGCYEDKPERMLEGSYFGGNMTVEKCVQKCTDEGDYYAGVENANQCFCGKHLKHYKKHSESECSTTCDGNSKQKCGGTWRISVYTTYALASTGYRYVGCYEDKPERILEGSYFGGNMTVEKCVQKCTDEGDYYAGVENGNQCFYGKHLKQYKKHSESECSTNCDGNSKQKCGGTWRISVYTTYESSENLDLSSKSDSEQLNTLASFGYRYVGCYEDKPERILEGSYFGSNMTVEKCVQKCTDEGDYYAGVENGNQCFYGKHLKQYKKYSDSDCSTKCDGNSKQKCGGTWRISVYTTYASIGYRYIGCYEDKSVRILEGSYFVGSMTVEMCVQKCTDEGDYYAGVEHADECFCGKHLKQYKKHSESECSYNCDGNSEQKCGGFWRISVYTTYKMSQNLDLSSKSDSEQLNTSIGYRYVGCYEDKSVRILEGRYFEGSMTVEKCVQKCTYEGDYYAGVEYANQCFCGKHLKQYKNQSESECSYNCGGNSEQKCGGSWRISVYTTYVNYLGCYMDSKLRLLEGPSTRNSKMTTEYCINYCKTFGMRFALTEDSSLCFCGNHLKEYRKTDNFECNSTCAGNTSEDCGGVWRGHLYAI